MMSRRQLTISVSSIALVVATGMLLLLLWQLRSLVLTVMIAVVVAAALAPLVDLAERMRIPRWLGVVVVYLSFIAGIAGLALLIGPTVVTQTQRLLARLPSYLERLQLLVDTWIADLAGVDPAALDYLIAGSAVADELGSSLRTTGAGAVFRLHPRSAGRSADCGADDLHLRLHVGERF